MTTLNPDDPRTDLELLTDGEETGCWDDNGNPCPWPDDFFLPDGTENPDYQTETTTNDDNNNNNNPF